MYSLVLFNISSPKGKIITQKLKDQSSILVVILLEGIKISHSAVKSLLSKLTSLIIRIIVVLIPYQGY